MCVQSAAWADLLFSVSARSADAPAYPIFALIVLIIFCCFLHRHGLPIRCVRDIRKTSRYTLRFNVCWFLFNLQVKLTGTLGMHSETEWRTVLSDSSVSIFCDNRMGHVEVKRIRDPPPRVCLLPFIVQARKAYIGRTREERCGGRAPPNPFLLSTEHGGSR